jgi:hypothetical protein
MPQVAKLPAQARILTTKSTNDARLTERYAARQRINEYYDHERRKAI